MQFSFDNFFDIERFRPHVESAREIACRYADRIVDELSAISTAVENPATIETVKTLQFAFDVSDEFTTFEIPTGEEWRLNYAVQFSPVANGRTIMREENASGRLLWGGFNSPDVPNVTAGGLELVGPKTLYVEGDFAGANQIELTLQFRVFRPNPKRRLARGAGIFERPAELYDSVDNAENSYRHGSGPYLNVTGNGNG